MQPIEKALNNVFKSLGNNYKLPVGEFINSDFEDNVKLKNPYYLQEPKNVKFGFGTEKELDLFLTSRSEKYPLVWLVYPVLENSDNTPNDITYYPSMRLIFAINNDSDKLVQTRVQTTRYILDQIVEKFCDFTTRGRLKKYIWMDKNKSHTQKFFPNYSRNEQKDSGPVDIWDAIVLDCDIYIYPTCMPNN